jgi:hypothetical protein
MALNAKPLLMSVEEVQAWEEKEASKGGKRKVHEVVFEGDTEDEELIYKIVRPTRYTVDTVTNLGKKGKNIEANEYLINSCVLAGDTEKITQDDELFYAILEEIMSLIAPKKKVR